MTHVDLSIVDPAVQRASTSPVIFGYPVYDTLLALDHEL